MVYSRPLLLLLLLPPSTPLSIYLSGQPLFYKALYNILLIIRRNTGRVSKAMEGGGRGEEKGGSNCGEQRVEEGRGGGGRGNCKPRDRSRNRSTSEGKASEERERERGREALFPSNGIFHFGFFFFFFRNGASRTRGVSNLRGEFSRSRNALLNLSTHLERSTIITTVTFLH